MGIVHHTNAEREYAYDRKSHTGRLDEARKRNGTAAGMKADWKQIFPPQ